MSEDWQAGGFGLYIHWPFCQSKCPYCDFNSHVAANIDQFRWRDAYLLEIDRIARIVPNRILNSVFFGGGTPSLMEPELVHTMLGRIHANWPTANDLEVTLEANPGSVEAGRFRGYAQAGVSRISMGIQALNDDDLRKLGRIHTASEALEAFDVARAQFDRVSFDLIYGRQNQTLDQWRAELGTALSLAVDHLSLYHLTIESGTAFGDRYEAGRLRGLPDDDLSADLYLLTQELCDEAGFPAYEVSNHAKLGSESRHNLIYWRYGDYAGIGPGAHGRLTIGGQRHASESWSNPDRWLTAAESGQPDKVWEALRPEDQAAELLMMGLRIPEGIDLTRYENFADKALNQQKINDLRDIGMVSVTQNRLRVTPAGRPVLNSVIRELA